MRPIHPSAARGLIVAAAVLLATALGGCELLGEDAPTTLCEAAQRELQACGVTAPLITDGPCEGLRRSVSLCVYDHTRDCADVEALVRRPDLCFVGLVDLPTDGPPDGSDLFPTPQ